MIENLSPTTHIKMCLLQAFGFSINYGMIVTVLGALGVTLITRLILDEMSM